jgi:hypothetical protein
MVDDDEEDDEEEDDDSEGLTPAFYFVNDIVVKIAEKEEKKSRQSLREEQLALLTVWHVSGIVENGALFYFFEHRFDVNEVVRAYEAVGLPEPAVVLKKAVAVLPNSAPPPNFEKLVDFMEEHNETFNSLSTKFLRAEKNMIAILGDYIRKNEAAFKEFM